MKDAFKSAVHFHQAVYYTRYRCFSVAVYNVTAALETQAQGAKSGFNVVNDNCLTKAVAIFNAYGNLNSNTQSPLYPKLVNGDATAPNTYFEALGTDAGWGPVQFLTYPPGTSCIFQAPTGATVAEGGGQVGWGFLDLGTGMYTFGATENNLCNCSVPSSGDSQSWISTGSEKDMYAAFKNGAFFHPSGYYLWYACKTSDSSYAGAASTMQTKLNYSGYDAGNDNCLTKTVAILSAYGENILYAPLYHENPNDYINTLTALGWNFFNVIPTLP